MKNLNEGRMKRLGETDALKRKKKNKGGFKATEGPKWYTVKGKKRGKKKGTKAPRKQPKERTAEKVPSLRKGERRKKKNVIPKSENSCGSRCFAGDNSTTSW